MIKLKLNEASIEQFHADGFVIVPEIIDRKTVRELLHRYEALFAGEFETGLVPDEVNWQPGRDADDVTRQICNAWKSDRLVARVVLDPGIGQACATLGGWPGARLNQDNVFWKPPGGSAIGFHQDSAYEAWVVPPDMVSCWIALDDTTTDGGTVEYIRGSQRWSHAPAQGEFHTPADATREMLVAARQSGIEQPQHVPVVVPAGGGAFHQGWTWHGSQENRATGPRRAIVAHCMSSAARYHDSNMGPIYSRYKRFGDTAMDESFFPILWREDGYRTPFLDAYTRADIGWGGG